MDWPLTGAVAGTLVLAGATTAWLSFLHHSSSDGLIVPKAPTLMSADSTQISSDSPRLSEPAAYPSTQTLQVPLAQTRTERVDGGKIQESTNQYHPYDSMASQPSRQPTSSEYAARRPSSSDHTKPASSLSVSTPLPAQPQTSIQEWRAVATARANSFNLGGHLDQFGVVDSLASSYLRDAFKKGKNYNKLPPEAKAWVEAANVNLSKLAPYRALLGIDDSKIEVEQAVKFVRVASTRGIDDADLDQETDVTLLPTREEGNADLLVLPPIR
jgi:hypothetical protein